MILGVQLGLATALFLFSGCRDLPSYESLFDTSPEAVGTGITGVGLVRAVVIIAKYQATERQRQVADQNARRAYRRIVAHREAIEGSTRPGVAIAHNAPEPTREMATNTHERLASAAGRQKQAPASAPAPRAPKLTPAVKPPKMARYLAVDTEPDARSKGATSVMIWDTATQEVVGNEVYDVQAPPPVMEEAPFETYTAQYVDGGDFGAPRKNDRNRENRGP